MSLINSSNDMTPFDLRERPVRQFLPISMLLWTVSYISTGGPKMKIRKIRMRGLKGPYLVMATHQGPMDYYIVPRLLFPRRANYVSDMEGFANYGKWLYRHGGCIGKRRYTPSVEALLNMKYVLEELREPLVIFPESRHCDAGVTSQFPDNLGALASSGTNPGRGKFLFLPRSSRFLQRRSLRKLRQMKCRPQSQQGSNMTSTNGRGRTRYEYPSHGVRKGFIYRCINARNAEQKGGCRVTGTVFSVRTAESTGRWMNLAVLQIILTAALFVFLTGTGGSEEMSEGSSQRTSIRGSTCRSVWRRCPTKRGS